MAPSSVTVLVPLHNNMRHIGAALDSILGETEPGFEVVVINDRSSDGSLAEVERRRTTRLRLIDSPGSGIAKALNAGLLAARGAIIMRCDADDLFVPGRLAHQAAWLSKRPLFGALCGQFATIDDDGHLVTEMATGGVAEEITGELRQGKTRTHLGTFAIRAAVLGRTDGFRAYFRTAEDIDLQLRLGESCRVWYEPKLSYYCRLHNRSITHTTGGTSRLFFDEMARVFQQQRLHGGHDGLQVGNAAPPPPVERGGRRAANEHIQDLLLGRAWQEHDAGLRRQALATGVRSVCVRPVNVAAWRSLVALVVKRSPIERS